MTVSNKNKVLIIILLIGVIMSACANEKKDGCIIFWDDNSELSLKYLNTNDYLTCIKNFPDFVKIPFSDIERYEDVSQVFILKNEIEADSYRRITMPNQLYVSIVIDNKIIFNGLNGFAISTLAPSDAPNKIEPNLQQIHLREKKYIIISDGLIWDTFDKRNNLDENLRRLIIQKIN